MPPDKSGGKTKSGGISKSGDISIINNGNGVNLFDD
jgi:hypothetical protein